MSQQQQQATSSQQHDAAPGNNKQAQQQSYAAWAKEKYAEQYEIWMPWIEDIFLKWFTKDNKASYTTKEQLSKTKITGVEQVDNLQDGVNNLAAGTLGQGGILQPVGDLVSKEGANRFERKGKDANGSYIPGIGGRNNNNNNNNNDDNDDKDGGSGWGLPKVPELST